MKRIKTQINNGDETQVTQFNPVDRVGAGPSLLKIYLYELLFYATPVYTFVIHNKL